MERNKKLKFITKSIFLRGASTFSIIFSSFLISVILNRCFGEESYGYLVLVFSVTSFFGCFVDIGTRATINRFLPRYIKSGKNSDAKHLFTTAVIFFVTGLFVFSLLIFVFSKYISFSLLKKPLAYPLIRVGALFFIGVSLSEFFSEIFQALQDWKKEMIVTIGYRFLYLVFICTAVFLLGWKIDSVLWANFLAAFLMLFYVLHFAVKKLFSKITPRDFSKHAKKIISFGSPLILMALNLYMVTWFDKILVGKYCAIEQLTYYYIGFIFINAMSLCFDVLFTVLRPYFSEISLHSGDKKFLKEKFYLLFRWFMHLSVILCVISFFFINPVVKIFYGESYHEVVTAFRLLLMIFLIKTLVRPMGLFMINVFGNTKKTSILSTSNVVITVLVSLLLVPLFGYKGAIIASLAGYVIWWILALFVFFREFLYMMPYKSFLKVCMAILGVSLVFVSINRLVFLHEILWGIILPGLYVSFILLMKEIKAQDKVIIKEVVHVVKGFFRH